MFEEPQKEHRWLQQLVGDWSFVGECNMGPDKPPAKSTGTERVRSLGGLWVLCEGEAEMPGTGQGRMLLTIGYDVKRERYVGSWVGSMMTHMFVYSGWLDDAGTTLTLATEGPSMGEEGKLANYRDVIEVRSPDHRIMTSSMQGPDGQWQLFMTAHYRRRI